MRLLVLFLFSTFVFSCKSPIEPKNCKKIDRIEVYSIGYPNLTFSIKQTEEAVRTNLQGAITNDTHLNRIMDLVGKMQNCDNNDKELVSIVGVADFYCDNGEKFTLIYDSYSTKINDKFYCKTEKLIKELFEGNNKN